MKPAPRQLSVIDAEMKGWIAKQTAAAKEAVSLKGHARTRKLREAETYATKIAKLGDERLRAQGLR